VRLDKLNIALELILLLTDNRRHTAEDLCSRLSMTRRNLYYYFTFFRENHFRLVRDGRYYYLDRNSPFLKKLHRTLEFTEDEAVVLRRLVADQPQISSHITSIASKLDRFYDLNILSDAATDEQFAARVSTIYDAIKAHKMILIRNYSSPHSRSVSDRIIEPFLLMNGNTDVRGFELKSKTNKTYRISRMGEVQLIDADWIFEPRHRALYTDIFMFSGEEKHNVKLILGQLAHNIMIEEHPRAAELMTELDSETLQSTLSQYKPSTEKHWLFEADVCSYLGIGRFVLGLADDITVLENDDFKAYLRSKRDSMQGF